MPGNFRYVVTSVDKIRVTPPLATHQVVLGYENNLTSRSIVRAEDLGSKVTDTKIHKYDEDVEAKGFLSTFGIEFSYLAPRNKGPRNREVESCKTEGLAYLLKSEFLQEQLKFYKIQNDCGAIEISSPPFWNLTECKNYFDRMHRIAKKYDLVTHRRDVWSGGGHIHVALPIKIQEDVLYAYAFLGNLFRDIANRPYLNWIFNEWCDNESAGPYPLFDDVNTSRRMQATGLNIEKILYDKHVILGRELRKQKIYDAFGVNKSHAARLDYNSWDDTKPPTVEFRFFDAKRNWRECEAHVSFINSYVRYINGVTDKNTIIDTKVYTRNDVAELARDDQGLSEFRKLLDQLELDYGSYEPFIRVNYRKRQAANLLK